jgi:hypothetical protein
MQYKKKTHPPSSIKDIRAMHISTSLRGVRKLCGFSFCESNLSLYRLTIDLLQHTAIHITIVINTAAAENGNKKH